MGNWYIGPARAKQLADYAALRWDVLASELSISDESATSRIENDRQKLYDEILTWEDESLGPMEEGIPLSNTGTGAKDRYLAAIDAMVDNSAARAARGTVTAELDARLAFVPPERIVAEPVQDERPAFIPPERIVPDPVFDDREAFVPPPPTSAELFDERAEAMMSMYIYAPPALKKALKNQAAQYVEDYGIEEALEILQKSLDSEIRASNWRIGPSRSQQLAEYAIARFGIVADMAMVEDESIASVINEYGVFIEQALRDEVLLWEDEGLGPEIDGVPLSDTGAGAKGRYIDAIDGMVDEELALLVQSGELSDEWFDRHGLNRNRAMWEQEAAELLSQYPTVIDTLKNQFKVRADQVFEESGLEAAMNNLRENLDVMKRASESQASSGGLNASVLRQLFGTRR